LTCRSGVRRNCVTGDFTMAILFWYLIQSFTDRAMQGSDWSQCSGQVMILGFPGIPWDINNKLSWCFLWQMSICWSPTLVAKASPLGLQPRGAHMLRRLTVGEELLRCACNHFCSSKTPGSPDVPAPPRPRASGCTPCCPGRRHQIPRLPCD
jgi:hypothetical protein